MPGVSEKTRGAALAAEAELQQLYHAVDMVSAACSERVLDAFRRTRVSETHFAGSTGYGYGDAGREALERVYADVFDTEAALVRIGFANGTHAIASALYACCESGGTLVSCVGAPYDTLRGVIGIDSPRHGSLAAYGTNYREIPILPDGRADIDAILAACADPKVCCALIQRSRGYTSRQTLSVADIGALYERIKAANPRCCVVIDNCYGEFTEMSEPRGDLICGSLIKNVGGGLAPTGGYVVGKTELVERAAERQTVPGIGSEVGATMGVNRLLFQGFFLAPHVVGEALKAAIFAAKLFSDAGFVVSPSFDAPRSDIIQQIELGDGDKLLRFMRGIQAASPVDSFVTPEPWDMPGYDCPVVMAAGTFIQGSSLELSCDAPMTPPYCVFLQGGLTYATAKLAVMSAFDGLAL